MLFNLSCSQLENGLHSNQTDIYLKSIVIGQKSTCQIAQNIYMVESWCDFRMLSLTSGTFGRPSRVFREYSDIVEKDIFSRRLRIFVLQGLAGMDSLQTEY